MHVVGVCLYLDTFGHLIVPDNVRMRAERFSGGFVQSRAQQDGFHPRRFWGRLAIVERFGCQRDGAFKGPLKARSSLLDAGVL